MKEIKLKPCPHCGGKAIGMSPTKVDHIVLCQDCRCSSALSGSAEDAVATWNRRVGIVEDMKQRMRA